MAIPSRRVFGVTLKSEFSFIYIYLVAGISLLIAVFLFISPANAQAEEGVSEPAAVETPVEPATEPAAEEQVDQVVVSESDEQVTHEDLEVKDAQVLPDSPLYKFKRFGRGLKEAFTFDPVKKAGVRLQNANQELFDGQKLLGQSEGDDNKTEAALDAIGRFEKKITTISERIGGLQVKKEQGDEKVGEFLDTLVDREIKQQKILERLQEKVAKQSVPETDKVLERLQEVQEQSGKTAGETLIQIEDSSEALTERFDRVLQKQKGSEFKDLRNFEVLEQLGDRVPEQARDAIRHAQENALKRFAENVKGLSEETRQQGFERYAQQVGGDEVGHIQIFDRLKQIGDLPPDVLQKMEEAKDIFATRFQERLQNFDTQFQDGALREKARERAMRQFDQIQGEDLEKLRAVDEIRQRIQFEDPELEQKMEERHNQAIEKFQQTFSDPESSEQAEKFRELSKKMAENPDPTTFRLIEELQQRVKSDPKKQEFVERMEQEAKAEFAERAKNMQEKFFEQISSNNPQDIEIFKKLQQDFIENPGGFAPPEDGEFLPPGAPPVGFGPPPQLLQFFDKAIEKQTEFLGQHFEEMESPEMRRQFEEKFEGLPPGILEQMKRRQVGEGPRPEFDQAPAEFREEFEARIRGVRQETSNRGEDVVCDEGCQREQKQRFEERVRVEERNGEFEVKEKIRQRVEGPDRPQGPGFEGEQRPFDKQPEFPQGARPEFRREVPQEVRERVQEFVEQKRGETFEQRQNEGPGPVPDAPRPEAAPPQE